MFDFFGLRKEALAPRAGEREEPMSHRTSSETPRRARHEKSGQNAESPGLRGARRFWAVLFLLDTLFLFVFGLALASRIYLQPVKAPPTAAVPSRRAQPKKIASPSETPASAATAADPSAAKTAPQPAPSARHAPAAAQEPRKGPLGSPSVLAPELPRREPAPAGAARTHDAHPPAPAAAPRDAKAASPAEKPRAKPVEFACATAKNAREVLLKGPFLVRTGGLKLMTRDPGGAWRTEISLLPGNYKYYFVIDGKRSKPQTIEVR